VELFLNEKGRKEETKKLYQKVFDKNTKLFCLTDSSEGKS
jgi:hypothetical protein